LVRNGVDRIAIAGDEITVWREHQCQRPAQVLVLKSNRALYRYLAVYSWCWHFGTP
jgi:hypothetical protein